MSPATMPPSTTDQNPVACDPRSMSLSEALQNLKIDSFYRAEGPHLHSPEDRYSAAMANRC